MSNKFKTKLFGALDQRLLIRWGRIVYSLVFVYDNSMTYRQVQKNFIYCCLVFMVVIIQYLLQFVLVLKNKTVRIIIEVHDWFTLWWMVIFILIYCRDIERSNFGWKLFELHNVACQRPCFVREDIIDLTELFVYISALCSAKEVLLFVEHVQIVFHECTLEELDHLQGHKQRNRDKVATDKKLKIVSAKSYIFWGHKRLVKAKFLKKYYRKVNIKQDLWREWQLSLAWCAYTYQKMRIQEPVMVKMM